MKHTISSTDGICLVFLNQEDLNKYKQQLHELQMRTYHDQRQSHGVYSTNRGVFVNTFGDLNTLDDLDMEIKYSQWLESHKC